MRKQWYVIIPQWLQMHSIRSTVVIASASYCNEFDQCVARQQLCKHGQRAKMKDVSQRANKDAGKESRDLFSVWSAVCNNRTAFSVVSVQSACKRSEFRWEFSSGQLRVNSSGRSTPTSKQGESKLKLWVQKSTRGQRVKVHVCYEDFMCAIVQWYWECVS
jgi:hypothetical protein